MKKSDVSKKIHRRKLGAIGRILVCMLIILSSGNIFAQTVIKGVIKTDKGQFLSNVSVKIPGTSIGDYNNQLITNNSTDILKRQVAGVSITKSSGATGEILKFEFGELIPF